jgi:hypothetical protein
MGTGGPFPGGKAWPGHDAVLYGVNKRYYIVLFMGNALYCIIIVTYMRFPQIRDNNRRPYFQLSRNNVNKL